MKKELLLLLLLLVACEEYENCAEDPSAFTRDLCWTTQAKETKDVNLCMNIENRNDVCVGYVAAALNQPELCEKHATLDVKNCKRVYEQELVQNKIDACRKQKDTIICFNKLAIEQNDPNICGYSEEKILCAINYADENKNPQAILANTVAGEERDTALAIYASVTLDTTAWNLIQDPRIHDTSVIMTPTTAYLRTGEITVPEYCDTLKGNYEYNGEEEVEAEVTRNKNICYVVVAAVESAARNEDLCGLRLSLQVESYYGENEEEIQDSIDRCKKLTKQLNSAEKLKTTDDFEEKIKLLKEFEIEE